MPSDQAAKSNSVNSFAAAARCSDRSRIAQVGPMPSAIDFADSNQPRQRRQ